MSGFCITLGAQPPEASHAPAVHVGHSTPEPVAQVLLEAQGAWKVHTTCSGHDDQRGKPEVRSELVPRRAGKAIALPLPILECRRVSWADGPDWEGGAQWPYAGFVPQVSVLRKSCHLFQHGLPLLTAVAEVSDVCVVSTSELAEIFALYVLSILEKVARVSTSSSSSELQKNRKMLFMMASRRITEVCSSR